MLQSFSMIINWSICLKLCSPCNPTLYLCSLRKRRHGSQAPGHWYRKPWEMVKKVEAWMCHDTRNDFGSMFPTRHDSRASTPYVAVRSLLLLNTIIATCESQREHCAFPQSLQRAPFLIPTRNAYLVSVIDRNIARMLIATGAECLALWASSFWPCVFS
jgi:hypothetical protein